MACLAFGKRGVHDDLAGLGFSVRSKLRHQDGGSSQRSERTIAVLSPQYFKGKYSHAEWTAVFRDDPKGEDGLLVPARVETCELPRLLGTIVYIDFVGLSFLLTHTVATSETEPRTRVSGHNEIGAQVHGLSLALQVQFLKNRAPRHDGHQDRGEPQGKGDPPARENVLRRVLRAQVTLRSPFGTSDFFTASSHDR